MKDSKLRNQTQELNLLEGAQSWSGFEASSRQKLLSAYTDRNPLRDK